tara:strand:- start:894 stop:1703 length:810 start_codon:yes stop_codon:yes gene_type:complete
VQAPPKTISIILNSNISNIRSILKSNDPEAIEELYKNLKLAILFLANTYTAANFKIPITEQNKQIIEASAEFVCTMFPQLAPEELKEAFKMAAAGRFQGLNIETYYGKFSVQILGKVLKAYIEFRKKCLAKYENLKQIEESRAEDVNKEAKNTEIRKQIAQIYSEIKKRYIDKGELKEGIIKAFWAKILLEEKIIDFTEKEKLEIYNQAKQKTKNEYKKKLLQNEVKASEKMQVRNLLKELKEGIETKNFKAAVVNEYSRLLIIKSILK